MLNDNFKKQYEDLLNEENIIPALFRPRLQPLCTEDILEKVNSLKVKGSFISRDETVLLFDNDEGMIKALAFGSDAAGELILPGETATPDESFYMTVYVNGDLWREYKTERRNRLRKELAEIQSAAEEAERQAK